jgi:hypothetical protein
MQECCAYQAHTWVTIKSVYQPVEDRDGMKTGVREGYERLDDLLAGMK